MAGQSITFDFLTRGADQTASGFRKVGDNTVLAAKGAKVLADAIEKLGAKEDRTAAESALLAKALRLTGDAEDRVAARAVLADAAIRKVGDAAAETAAKTEAAKAGFSGLAGSGGIPGGGMGAAIAAGVALSPVVATLAVGLGGLGLAALGVAKNQKLMATELAPLKTQFAGFTKALQPEVLGIFNTGIKIAGGLLHDIQPVAQATGKAFDGFLGQIDAEFKSRTWQDFFGFMAQQAGPDMKLLANAVLPLLDTLPKLLADIQPIAVQLLQASAGALKLADASVTLNDKIHHLGTQAGQSGGFLGHFADAGKKALDQVLPGIPAAQALGKWLGVVGGSSDKAGKSTQSAGVAFQGAWPKAQSYAQWVQASAKATTDLANAQSAAVSTQLAYGNDILTSANDAQTFHDKLKASAGQIGLHTQAERDSFGAANTYIADLSRQATSAIASGHGTDAAITAIRNGLPALDSAKTKNHQYWQEVATLVGYLNKLSLIKFINTPIHVTGTGKWSVTGTSITPGLAHGPQNIGAAPGAATGLFIDRGTGPTADDVLIRASKGELIVPTHMVRAGAVDHLRGQIPGFAAGGVAGSYGPAKVSGLPPWISGRINATDTAIAQNTAQAIVNAMAAARSAASAAGGAPGSLGGPASAGAAQAQSYAASRLGAYGWSGAQMKFLISLWNQESGWNRLARNPSSGAYGIPQALPPGKMGAAANPPTSSAAAQINWGLGYIKGRYGSPQNAWGHELSFNWYKHGGLVPGYASGGTVAREGAAYLRAWKSRSGGGFGAAHGPVVVNEQIARMTAALGRAQSLAGASGLSPGQHRFWASAAADEKKRLGVLHKELATERSWRTMLELDELALAREVASAGNLPGLAGPARGWKAEIGRDKATVAGISKMLGYSGAYLAAHKAAPKVPAPGVPGSIPHTGVYTDSTASLIAQLFASLASNNRVVTLDSGGWLMPGVQAVANKTGRPEQVIPPGRGGYGGGGTIVLENHGVIGSQAQLEDWLVRTVDSLKRKRRI